MAAKKYYAVAVGRRPGIYDTWPLAQVQVTGFAGAVYKGFTSRAEAEAWLKNPSYGSRRAARRRPAAKAGAKTHPPPSSAGPRNGEVVIYTDGGARYNPGPGGYGIVQLVNGERRELSGGFRHTTNNRMELMGCIVALRTLEHHDRPVTLYTDSSYVVNGITKGWARGWRRRGWIKSDKQPAVNPDLWGELLDLVDGLDITFRWVKGHAGHPMNERCDELAVAASRRPDLPEDHGYRG